MLGDMDALIRPIAGPKDRRYFRQPLRAQVAIAFAHQYSDAGTWEAAGKYGTKILCFASNPGASRDLKMRRFLRNKEMFVSYASFKVGKPQSACRRFRVRLACMNKWP